MGCVVSSRNPPSEPGKNGQGSKEKELMDTIKREHFEEIENKITPLEFQNCESTSLRMGMKVNFELRRLAERKGPDIERFHQLANSVEEYTTCLLDPMRSDEGLREQFGDYLLDGILDDAIEFEQKKFFTHPVIHEEVHRKWHGRKFKKWKCWKPVLTICCLFDLAFSLILFAVFSLLKTKVSDAYLMYLEVPYLKFVRDTFSYLALLGLHYAMCLAPSTTEFSGLELAILIFFFGRFLVEWKQICDNVQRLKRQKEKENDGDRPKCIILKSFCKYISDSWNKLDFVSLLVYFVIFMLKVYVAIWAKQGMNNRVLFVASFLYGFNTICLTFRAFGHVMEQSKHVGTIQIALFSILSDIRIVLGQFVVAVLAFSFALAKVYMAEKTFIGGSRNANDIACKETGISCWLTTFKHLCFSLLGVPGFEPILSVDPASETLALLLYSGFLVLAVILLVNMLIALLSHTYERTKFIKTDVFEDLEKEYFAKHTNLFPVTDEKKLDQVLLETERNRQMVSQILSSTFNSQGSDLGILHRGPEAWKIHEGIRIEGLLLTCESSESCPDANRKHFHGARYLTPFSFEFPHFEVTILETGDIRWPGIGVVDEKYDTSDMPGWRNESLGYHTDDGKIYHNDTSGKETKGPSMARRGDLIRCTVIFEQRNGQGQVPVSVCFTLNGRRIVIQEGEEDQIALDHVSSFYPYIGMTDGCSVLAKMCPRENKEYEVTKIAQIEKRLEDTNQKLDMLLARIPARQTWL